MRKVIIFKKSTRFTANILRKRTHVTLSTLAIKIARFLHEYYFPYIYKYTF